MSDEMLSEAVSLVSPPLLADSDLELLTAELDTTRHRKRGRPSGNVLARKRIAIAIAEEARQELPPEIRLQLVDRLLSGKRYPERQRSLDATRARRTLRRLDLMRDMHMLVCELLDRDGPLVHELLGPIERPVMEPGTSRGNEALLITHQLLVKYRMRPPSLGRLRNMVAPGYYRRECDRLFTRSV